jgi:hypothetical protein
MEYHALEEGRSACLVLCTVAQHGAHAETPLSRRSRSWEPDGCVARVLAEGYSAPAGRLQSTRTSG